MSLNINVLRVVFRLAEIPRLNVAAGLTARRTRRAETLWDY